MDYHEYNSVGEWNVAAREAGYRTNLPMLQGISQTMARRKMSFAEAFGRAFRKNLGLV